MSWSVSESFRGLLVIGSVVVGMAATRGAEISWITTTGSFTTGSNWSSGTVPTVGDVALIANGCEATLTLPGGAVVEGPQMALGRDGSGTLLIEGSGSVTVAGPAFVGTTTVDSPTAGLGTLSIGSGTSITVLGG